jgi:hypothetical protein
MYRLLEETPASPKNSRHPARATANEAALKREKPAGEVCKWHGGENHRPDPLAGRPVTSREMRNAAPKRAAFVRLGNCPQLQGERLPRCPLASGAASR